MSHFSRKILKHLEKGLPPNLEPHLREIIHQIDLQEKIWNSLQEGVLITNNQGIVLSVNEPFLSLFQTKEEKLIEKPIKNFLSLFEISSEDFIQNLFQFHQTLSVDLFLDQPEPFWCRLYATPFLNEKGELTGTCLTFKDITDLKQLDKKKIFTEKWNTLIPLAAGLAHEIGNPLNSLNIHIQLAERQIRDLPGTKREKLSQSLKVAQEEIKRLDKIVSHFLGAIRPLKINFKEKNINDLLDRTLDFMIPEISQAKVTVERRFQTNLPKIFIDEDQLKQAFYNIIKNSLQAMPEGGQLKVQTELKNQQISIHFSDTGVGINSKELNYIFEPYYSSKEKGSGLGLVVVNRIISDHGGSIQVRSKLGKGTQFGILLPLHSTKRPLLLKGKIQQPKPRKKNKK